MSAAEEQGMLRIKLVKSPIGYSKRQRGTLQALGLRRMYSSVVQADTPAIRGMVAKVDHLVEVEEVEKE
jgi:large subunit ribosomal protein L30